MDRLPEETPLPQPAPIPAQAAELAPLLAELDRLSEQAAQLRQRIARLGAATPRPGWPIRRIAGPGGG